MKIEHRFPDSIDFEFNNGCVISFWQCLTEIFIWRRYNWNTWQFINIEFENDMCTGTYELTFVVMCCGVRIRIPNETEKSESTWSNINEEIKDISKETFTEDDFLKEE
jgi:hypothetical protein